MKLPLLLFSVALLHAAEAPPFEWRGSLAAGQTLEVKGISGEIRVEPATGSDIQVSARITARRSDPNKVRVEVVPRDGGISICSVYPTEEGDSGCNGRGNVRDNDTRVNFSVKLPRGVRLVARTVNGEIVARGLQSAIDAHTVNGRVEVATTEAASAHTVNGDIVADVGRLAEPTKFQTVNGSITVGLPAAANANVRASVVNGSIQPDFPLTLSGSFSGKKINGRINNGGPELSLNTVNGSIRIKHSTGVI
jgi:hypothetical protein